MFPYNIVESQCEPLLQKCRDKNIGFIAMKPMAGGAIEDGRIAMRYLAANELVTVAIPGMYCAEEVQTNSAAGSDTSPLTDDENAEIAKIRSELTGNFCRRCNYCAPAPSASASRMCSFLQAISNATGLPIGQKAAIKPSP